MLLFIIMDGGLAVSFSTFDTDIFNLGMACLVWYIYLTFFFSGYTFYLIVIKYLSLS